jgi:hypothetical protein
MSTRATYAFLIGGKPAVTVYIHHDGYPEGAARYFWNAHHNEGRCDHPLTRFLRANDRAEITSDHDAHGDTEYRYTLTDERLTAWERRWNGDTPVWRVIFEGPLIDFVNKYGASPRSFWRAEFTPIREVVAGPSYWRRKVKMSRGQIEKRLEAAQTELARYREAHPTMTGNIGGLESDLAYWVETLTGYDVQQQFENAPEAATH